MSRLGKWDTRQGYRETTEALAGVEFLTAHDLLDLLGENSREATPENIAAARALLELHGYRERKFTFFGRRAFRRFEKVIHDPSRPRTLAPLFGPVGEGELRNGDA